MGTEAEKKADERNEGLVSAINHLATTVEKRTDQLRRFNYFVITVLAAIVILAVWNRTTLSNTKDILDTINSITNPNGELYRQSQLRTVGILQRNAVENDCRNRRREAGLPAPDTGTPDQPQTCIQQTPPEVYPGPAVTVPIPTIP